MSLSNWLTRGEWNAAYFVYHFCQATSEIEEEHDLSTALRYGICVLDKLGYKSWTGVKVPDNADITSVEKDVNSKYGSDACIKEGYNAACMVEIMMGELEYTNRLQETINWINHKNEINDVFKNVFIDFCEKMIQKLNSLSEK